MGFALEKNAFFTRSNLPLTDEISNCIHSIVNSVGLMLPLLVQE